MTTTSPANPVYIAVLSAAHTHAKSVPIYVRQQLGVAVKWVYDLMLQRAKPIADECGAQVTDDLQQVLDDPQVTAVMIFSPTNQHDELIEAAIGAGKHLYVDKPLAISAQRSWRLAERINESGLIFSSGLVLRRRRHHIFLRDQIRRGAFGHITRIRHVNGNSGALRGTFDNESHRWFTQPKLSGGGALIDEGVHSTDMVLWLLGQYPKRVTGAVGNVTGRYSDCEEFGQGLMVFDNGTIGAISGSWVDTAKTATLEISGTEGCAIVLADRDLYVTSPHIEGADGNAVWIDMPAGQSHPQAVFLDAIGGRVTGELINVNDLAAASAVMATMMQAAAQGQWLDVPAGIDNGAKP